METEVLSENDIVRGVGAEVAAGGAQSIVDETSSSTQPSAISNR